MNRKFIASLVIFSLAFMTTPIRRKVADVLSFTFAFIKNPAQIGSLVPSSPALANELVKHIGRRHGPLRILEVGGGTGAVTEKITAKLKPGDVLDVLEIDPILCSVLQREYASNPSVRVFCMPIQDWRPSYRYDFIVSGLPFAVMKAVDVEGILGRYKRLIARKGMLSYFRYMWLRYVKVLFLSTAEKDDFYKLMSILDRFYEKYGVETAGVYLNIPPAYVFHHRL